MPTSKNTKVIEEEFNSEQSIHYFIPESEKLNKYKELHSKKKVEDTVNVLEQLEMEFQNTWNRKKSDISSVNIVKKKKSGDNDDTSFFKGSNIVSRMIDSQK